jgi:hypothetical protein
MPGYNHCKAHSRGVYLGRRMTGRYIPLQPSMGKRRVDHSKFQGQGVSEGLTEATPGVVGRRQTLGTFPTDIPGRERVEPHGRHFVF